jgi:ABC-2 type transport system ATP-binding protein
LRALRADGRTILITTHYMDEAERCHRLAYIGYGKLLAQGTVKEVVENARLTTWEVTGPKLMGLADKLRREPGVRQAVPFGNALHVSGDDEAALERAIDPCRVAPYTWRKAQCSLEDVFIHLMDRLKDNAQA